MLVRSWLLAASCLIPSLALAQDAPTRDDVADYFAGVRADLYTCGGGWHGEVEASITFAGDGRALDVVVSGDGLPDAAQRCVRSVLVGARMRSFDGPAAVVEHSFRL